MLGRLEPLVPGTANSELQKPGQEAPTLASFFATKSLGLRSAGPRTVISLRKTRFADTARLVMLQSEYFLQVSREGLPDVFIRRLLKRSELFVSRP